MSYANSGDSDHCVQQIREKVYMCDIPIVETKNIQRIRVVRSWSSLRQLISYVLQYSTILSADNENHDQAAWLHRLICARVGLISKLKNNIYTEMLVNKVKIYSKFNW